MKKKPNKKNQITCNCPAYQFPHRSGGGKCPGPEGEFCPGCEKPIEETGLIEVDCGIGPYEFWGHKEVHHDWRLVTYCCHEVAKKAEDF